MALHHDDTITRVPLADLPPLRTRRPADIVAPVILGAITLVAFLINLTNWPRIEDDEGTYVGQAGAILNGTLTPYTYTYDHPPAGWIQLAPFQWITGLLGLDDTSAIYAGRITVALFAIATVVFMYLLARRFITSPLVASIAPLIWITSGMVHDDARAVYLDNFTIPWLLAAFWFATTPRRNLWAYFGAGATFGVAVLSKETMLVFAPVLLYTVWKNTWPQLKLMHLTVFLATTILTVIQYPLFAALKTEFLPRDDRASLAGTFWWQLGGRDGSGWLWDTSSDRYQIVSDWWYYDKWIIIFGTIAAVVCLVMPRTRILGLIVASWAVPVVLMQGYLPSMYHLAVLPFFAISIAAVIAVAVRRIRTRPTTTSGAAANVAVVAALALVAGFTVWQVVPNRADRMAEAWTSDGSPMYTEARAWALENIPVHSPVITNGELWNDFLNAGWTNDEVVPFTKVDRDPSFAGFDPQWIVMTPTLARDAGLDPTAEKFNGFLDDATVAAEFGDYKIMKVNP